VSGTTIELRDVNKDRPGIRDFHSGLAQWLGVGVESLAC